MNGDIVLLLRSVCGLEVTETELPVEMPTDGIYTDVENDRTVFSVCDSAFSLSGCGKDRRVIAALARAFVLQSHSSEAPNTVRAFLNGEGDAPMSAVGKYYVLAVYGVKGVFDYISAVSDSDDIFADMGGGVTAFCKYIGKRDDYRSAGEFAQVLKDNMSEEIDGEIKIGVGGISEFSALPQFYAYAKSALLSGAELDPNGNVYSYKEYSLYKLLKDLPADKKDGFVQTAVGKNFREVFEDDELVNTADMFIKNSLNISETSRNMYVHRNTLIYRLDKIEKLTGLDIRSFGDAMMFRIAYMIYRTL